MMKWILIMVCVICIQQVNAQPGWQWTALAQMPMATSNNAVCSAHINGNDRVYSFGGIDTSLTSAGIHQGAFMYDVSTGVWSTLQDIPDTLGKIASGASVVGPVAYVIGGYHVFSGSPFELSSNKVHRLELSTNIWLSDGAPMPVPIDDHVQSVWRDSLIYVITGWSNTTNVPDVQIYDPALDAWSIGTPVPNNGNYKVFGASGVIIGDTIHYYGGASTGANFPAQEEYRRGIIDPTDPTQVTWQPAVMSPAGKIYRSGAFVHNEKPYWLGGSQTSYNYNGVAYNGSGVVAPVPRITCFDPMANVWQEGLGSPHDVMDLRGIGDIGQGRFIVTGGMGSGQQVLSSTYLIEAISVGIHGSVAPVDLQMFVKDDHLLILISESMLGAELEIFSVNGKLLLSTHVKAMETRFFIGDMPSGIHHVKLSKGTHVETGGFWSGN